MESKYYSQLFARLSCKGGFFIYNRTRLSTFVFYYYFFLTIYVTF